MKSKNKEMVREVKEVREQKENIGRSANYKSVERMEEKIQLLSKKNSQLTNLCEESENFKEKCETQA